MRFVVKHSNSTMTTETYFSIGGGFIEKKGKKNNIKKEKARIPFPVETASDMIQWCELENKTISQISLDNEMKWNNKTEIYSRIDILWETMLSSIYKGCTTTGTLPGGLNVERRASQLCLDLLGTNRFSSRKEWLDTIYNQPNDMETVMKWVSCYALAVNEVNASYGKIVTAPTNGAAGVIPSVLLYNYIFREKDEPTNIRDFFLVAGEIGMLFKKGATISAAAGGCQAEIGVSSAMAAGALANSMGGDIHQVLMAAEIAMEHHLGLSCDPIGGLVQIPCIERNTMGAIKAITAAQLSCHTNPSNAKVSLDDVIKTMWETSKDMSSKYKETSEGGLALQIPVSQAEC
jgi:L-serine dehydratase